MRFKFAIFGILFLQGAILVAQDPAPSSGTPLPPIRRGPQSRVFTLTPAETGTPPTAQPNPNGLPAGQQQPPQVVGQPNSVVAQPNPRTPSQPLPGQAVPQQGASPASGNPAQEPAPSNLPPPTPPQVTYRDGQLTVHALNCTLGSVLMAIRNKTGMQFEGMDTASERIVVSMGPAPEGEVLAAILTGSHYDYIAVDRADSPGIVQRVILAPRIGGPAPPTIGGIPATSNGEDEEAADDEPDNVRNPQDTPARPPVMQAQPIPPQPNPQQQGEQPAVKSPEQYLEELKQIQQRQQQQSQQQQPPAPQKVPQ